MTPLYCNFGSTLHLTTSSPEISQLSQSGSCEKQDPSTRAATVKSVLQIRVQGFYVGKSPVLLFSFVNIKKSIQNKTAQVQTSIFIQLYLYKDRSSIQQSRRFYPSRACRQQMLITHPLTLSKQQFPNLPETLLATLLPLSLNMLLEIVDREGSHARSHRRRQEAYSNVGQHLPFQIGKSVVLFIYLFIFSLLRCYVWFSSKEATQPFSHIPSVGQGRELEKRQVMG